MKTQTTVKVSKRNQITLPVGIRRFLNIQVGDCLLVEVQDGVIIMMRKPDPPTDPLVNRPRPIQQE